MNVNPLACKIVLQWTAEAAGLNDRAGSIEKLV
jgi:hypothetical protein